MSVLIRHAEVAGRVVDVRIEGGSITHVGADLPTARSSVDAAGAALLPGLHDHHLHLLALAAARESVQVGPEDVEGIEVLAAALDQAPVRHGWIRATGYHESVAGALDRHLLDRLVPGTPLRVQHRGGALWMLNSAALAQVAEALDESPDVERDERGEPTGRLWRYDARLRAALPDAPPDLAPVGHELARYGITSVTDATPDLDAAGIALLAAARASGALPQQITLLGADHTDPLPAGITLGPRKLLLRDHDLPTYDDLIDLMRAARAEERAVAVHCVTRQSLILTLAALEEVGSIRGDRIEHASVAPPETSDWMARLGVTVITQPDLVRTRAAQYARDVDPEDLPHLYPYASLLAAGVAVCASSDAPYGSLDPWQAMATAAHRTLGHGERVGARNALQGYLRAGLDPSGPERRIGPGMPADLVLLDRPLAQAMREPSSDHVATTWIGGRAVT